MGPFAQRPKGFVEVSPRLGEGVLNADRRGSYSLDSLFGITLPEPVTGIVAAGLAVAGVAFAMVRRTPAVEHAAAELAA